MIVLLCGKLVKVPLMAPAPVLFTSVSTWPSVGVKPSDTGLSVMPVALKLLAVMGTVLDDVKVGVSVLLPLSATVNGFSSGSLLAMDRVALFDPEEVGENRTVNEADAAAASVAGGDDTSENCAASGPMTEAAMDVKSTPPVLRIVTAKSAVWPVPVMAKVMVPLPLLTGVPVGASRAMSGTA